MGKCKHAPSSDGCSFDDGDGWEGKDWDSTKQLDDLKDEPALALMGQISGVFKIKASTEEFGEGDGDESSGTIVFLDLI